MTDTHTRRFETTRARLELDLRTLNAPIGSGLAYEHDKALRELETAVTAAGHQFWGDHVRVELRLSYETDPI